MFSRDAESESDEEREDEIGRRRRQIADCINLFPNMRELRAYGTTYTFRPGAGITGALATIALPPEDYRMFQRRRSQLPLPDSWRIDTRYNVTMSASGYPELDMDILGPREVGRAVFTLP